METTTSSRQSESPSASGKAAAYSITVPASHAAHVIDRNYAFRPQPGQRIEPTVDNIARIIDYSTRFPQMLPVMQWFSKEHPWYDPKTTRSRVTGASYVDDFLDWLGEGDAQYENSGRLADDIERLRHGIRQIETAYEKLPKAERKGIPCGAAWNACKNLCKMFVFSRKGRLAYTEKNLALLIDTSANCFRVQASMEKLLEQSQWLDRFELERNIERARQGMRIIELVNNSMPSLWERHKYQIKTVERQPMNGRNTSQREVAELRSRLDTAVTPDQEQQVLRDWRIHTNGNS